MRLLLAEVEARQLPGGVTSFVEMEDVTGNTALMIAVESGSGEVRQPRQYDCNQLYCIYSLVQSASALVAAGARVNLSNCEQMSPLLLAASHGVLGVARLLVKHGAELDTTNSALASPLHLASGKIFTNQTAYQLYSLQTSVPI